MTAPPADPGVRLSIVVTSRNDDHGGDMLRRQRLFLDTLVEQARRHDLRGEIVFVEWNPPDGPGLADVLVPSDPWEGMPVRFIHVPPDVHEGLPNSGIHPLFQMIAKNVGIRRARGEYILATNPDLLFSEELIEHLARGPLDPDEMLRLDRTDVDPDLPDSCDTSELLEWCSRHVRRVHGRWGTRVPGPPFRFLRRAGVSLGRLLREPRRLVPGTRARLARLARAVHRVVRPAPVLHTNACGDFTLLHRDRWFRLQGYAELPLWSMHLDSLLCYAAVADGARERVLRSPHAMYHVDHGMSWTAITPEARLALFGSKPWLGLSMLEQAQDDMWREGAPIRYNRATWGFVERNFPETRMPEASRPVAAHKESSV